MNTKESEQIKLEYIGSIISGTLRSDDLMPRLLEVAEEMVARLGDKDLQENVKHLLRDYAELDEDDEDMWDYLLNEDIWPVMESLAPEGYYFGAHPGDGADFGFWEIEEE